MVIQGPQFGGPKLRAYARTFYQSVWLLLQVLAQALARKPCTCMRKALRETLREAWLLRRGRVPHRPAPPITGNQTARRCVAGLACEATAECSDVRMGCLH